MKKTEKRAIFLILAGIFFMGNCSGSNPQEDEGGFTLSREGTTVSFSAQTGYSDQTPRSSQVTNTKSTSIVLNVTLTGDAPESFTLSTASINLAAKASGSFTVAPKTGLAKGDYQAAVTVGLAGNSGDSKSFAVKFTVTEAGPETHLYIAFGQSNMQGPGEAQAQDQNDVPERFQTLNVVGATYAYGNTVTPGITPNSGKRVKGEWYKAVPPNIINGVNPTGSGGTKTGLSPVDYFGRTLAENTPERITIGLIAVANGDLALASFHKTRGVEYFAPGSGGDGRESSRPSSTERDGWERYTTTSKVIYGDTCDGGYESIYDAIITNVKKAQEQGGMVKGIIFHQGESGRGLTYTSWPEMLKEIYDDMLADLELEPNSVPILCGQLLNGGTGPDGALADDASIQAYLGPNAHIVATSGCAARNSYAGDPHFSTEGIRELGARYGNKMLELVY